MTRFRFLFFLIVAAVACVVAFVSWEWLTHEFIVPPGAITSRGGEKRNLEIEGGDFHYRQGDEKWGREKIGGSGESIGAVGCTLCSVAMAVSKLGHEIDPKTLNDNLIEHSGYTDRGWMIWGAIPSATEDFAEVVVHGKPSFEVIDASLKRGEIPIVKFFYPNGIPHWVPVIGKRGDDYLIKDPALKNTKTISLSSRAKSIHSVRVVRKK